MGHIVVAVGAAGLTPPMVETVARLAGTGAAQEHLVTVVHVARVWGSGLGIQHPALQPSADERTAAQQIARQAAVDLRSREVDAEPLVISGRDTGKALAALARRKGATTVVVGRSRSSRLGRLLHGPDPARRVLGGTSCTVVVASSQ